MTAAERVCLRSYVRCIRTMLEAIAGLGIPAPSEVVIWIQGLEARATGG
jgi:hypothetical protein